MIMLKDITITLGAGTSLERHVLKKLNVRVDSGEFLVVIGSNGAGKSTMFNILSGLMRPDSGTVVIDGVDVTYSSGGTYAALVAQVVQDPRVGTMEHMTIYENMAFAYKRGTARLLIPFDNESRRALFKSKLSLLGMGLEDRLDDLVGNLSGGQRQALSLIMAIVSGSKLLLLDEITAALDPKTAAHVMRLAYQIIRQEKRTCVMITHNMAQAIEYADRIVLLKEGRCIKEFAGLDIKQLTPLLLASEFGEV